MIAHHIKHHLCVRHLKCAPGNLIYAACLIWTGNDLIGSNWQLTTRASSRLFSGGAQAHFPNSGLFLSLATWPWNSDIRRDKMAANDKDGLNTKRSISWPTFQKEFRLGTFISTCHSPQPPSFVCPHSWRQMPTAPHQMAGNQADFFSLIILNLHSITWIMLG